MTKDLDETIERDPAEKVMDKDALETETEADQARSSDKVAAMQSGKEAEIARTAEKERLSDVAKSRTRGFGKSVGLRAAAAAAAGVLAVGGLAACGSDEPDNTQYDCVVEGQAPTQAQIDYANQHNDGLIPECPDDDYHTHSGGGFFYYGSSGHQPSRYSDTRAGSATSWSSWVSSDAAHARGVDGGGSPRVG